MKPCVDNYHIDTLVQISRIFDKLYEGEVISPEALQEVNKRLREAEDAGFFVRSKNIGDTFTPGEEESYTMTEDSSLPEGVTLVRNTFVPKIVNSKGEVVQEPIYRYATGTAKDPQRQALVNAKQRAAEGVAKVTTPAAERAKNERLIKISKELEAYDEMIRKAWLLKQAAIYDKVRKANYARVAQAIEDARPPEIVEEVIQPMFAELDLEMQERASWREELEAAIANETIPGLSLTQAIFYGRGTKVRAIDFDNWGDRNIRLDGGPGFNLKYISSTAAPIDALMQSISYELNEEGFGTDVTIQDYIDYVLHREANPEAYRWTENKMRAEANRQSKYFSAQEAFDFVLSLETITEETVGMIERKRKLSPEQKEIIIDHLQKIVEKPHKFLTRQQVESKKAQEKAEVAKEIAGTQRIEDSRSPAERAAAAERIQARKALRAKKKKILRDIVESTSATDKEVIDGFIPYRVIRDGDVFIVRNYKGEELLKAATREDAARLAGSLNEGALLRAHAKVALGDNYNPEDGNTFARMLRFEKEKRDSEMSMRDFLKTSRGKSAVRRTKKNLANRTILEETVDNADTSGRSTRETVRPTQQKSSSKSSTTEKGGTERFTKDALKKYNYTVEELTNLHVNLHRERENSTLSLEEEVSNTLNDIFTCYL